MNLLSAADMTLLAHAAKACGRVPDDVDGYGVWFRGANDPIVGSWQRWNPLVSNGDAMHLLIHLRMEVSLLEPFEVRVDARTGNHWTELLGQNIDESVRRAITCCAALLGGWTP